jgi:hypothetical protein
MRGIVFVLTVGLLTAGCGTSNGTTGSSRTTNSERKTCRDGTASPITERTLKRALGEKGIQVHRDDRCAPDALVTLSNTAAPDEEQDGVVASEGDIYCDIYPANKFGARIERFVWRNDPEPTYVRVLNVHCAIYPERAAHTNTLEQALRQLPGVSTKSTTVPSSDAIHD